jgi:hypothetical protein
MKPQDLDNCAFEVPFENSKLKIAVDFETVRKRVRSYNQETFIHHASQVRI